MGLAGRSHTLMYWKVATSFINGEASVNDPGTFSFDVLDRLLLQAFQAFPALTTVTVTVHTLLSGAPLQQDYSCCCYATLPCRAGYATVFRNNGTIGFKVSNGAMFRNSGMFEPALRRAGPLSWSTVAPALGGRDKRHHEQRPADQTHTEQPGKQQQYLCVDRLQKDGVSCHAPEPWSGQQDA